MPQKNPRISLNRGKSLRGKNTCRRRPQVFGTIFSFNICAFIFSCHCAEFGCRKKIQEFLLIAEYHAGAKILAGAVRRFLARFTVSALICIFSFLALICIFSFLARFTVSALICIFSCHCVEFGCRKKIQEFLLIVEITPGQKCLPAPSAGLWHGFQLLYVCFNF